MRPRRQTQAGAKVDYLLALASVTIDH